MYNYIVHTVHEHVSCISDDDSPGVHAEGRFERLPQSTKAEVWLHVNSFVFP